MTLTFTQENGLYVAEFEATAPFSIHLERPKGGFINMLQRSVDSGTFVAVKNFNPNYNATQVIDADCGQGAVYPKWIRLESAVEPSVAEVTFESESSGGGAGTESGENIEYLDIRAVDNENTKATLVCSSLLYRADVPAEGSIPGGIMIMPIGFNLAQGENPQGEITKSLPYVEAVAISNTMPYVLFGGDYSLAGIMKIFGGINNAEEILSSLPRLSRAQFFSLDNLEA